MFLRLQTPSVHLRKRYDFLFFLLAIQNAARFESANQ